MDAYRTMDDCDPAKKRKSKHAARAVRQANAKAAAARGAEIPLDDLLSPEEREALLALNGEELKVFTNLHRRAADPKDDGNGLK